MRVLMDDDDDDNYGNSKLVTAHTFHVKGSTSTDNTNLPPSSHTNKPDETAFKVDTNSTSITDGSGNLTGVFIDGGTLAEGAKNVASIDDEEIDGQITNSQVVTLLFQAVPSASGTISEIFFKNAERW